MYGEEKNERVLKIWKRTMQAIILLAVIANLAAVLRLNPGSSSAGATATTGLSPEQHKQLALKLQKQGMQAASVEAWREYLRVADGGRPGESHGSRYPGHWLAVDGDGDAIARATREYLKRQMGPPQRTVRGKPHAEPR